PLLDHELVEFVATLPPRFKLDGRTTKVLLRRSLDGRVPREAFERPKHGFTVPLAPWLRARADFVEETICSTRARERGCFDPRTGRRRWDRCRQGHDLGHEIWMLLMLEVWHRVFVDRARRAQPASPVA